MCGQGRVSNPTASLGMGSKSVIKDERRTRPVVGCEVRSGDRGEHSRACAKRHRGYRDSSQGTVILGGMKRHGVPTPQGVRSQEG